jgi:dipeptidyl aminopeptidase/acylaminoacyl peptidase
VSRDSAAPYGTWRSPITATDVAAGTHAVDDARFVGSEIWWSERRPSEAGRTGVFRRAADGSIEAVLAAPHSARSRVHEYGGGAWTATPDGRLVHVDARTQQVLLSRDDGELLPLTAAVAGTAFGELSVRGREVVAVREHTGAAGERVLRDIVAIPMDGSAVDRPSAIRSIVSGSDFVAYPRFSPDGTKLAWIAWNHPQMPWDGTELRVGDLVDGRVQNPKTLLGGTDESVLQPEWRDGSSLWCVTDRSGYWNPASVTLDGVVSETEPVERETGGPLWNLGASWFLPVAGGRLLLRSTFGSDRLELQDADATRRVLDVPLSALDLYDVDSGGGGDRVLLHGGSAAEASALQLLDLSTGEREVIRSDYDELPDPDYLPDAVERTFQGDQREVHAVVYPPKNPEFTAPEGEKPPYVAFVHGGPTAHSRAGVNLTYAYYTSRGIGVVDVNYGGSTGYGRDYRESLDSQWGVVDVEDVETAARGLVADGADPHRLGIEGSSAGGWTVLSCLARGTAFACGVSLYGVADLRSLVESTHDFERSYLTRLVGPLPEAEALYLERSPLSHRERLTRPVLILQGLDDPVVPPAQSEQLRDALLEAGVPHAYLTFEGESHGFRRADTKTRVREAAISFYGQVFGFVPPEVPELELWRPTREPDRRETRSRPHE